ncbi:MAG TPA: 4a-hydroxytetrahydrobiopterin dehydratase [Candidatus Thermoplasmatota archaeon]|nr:4a-hydroxytetrahydrobiopterin dehydratase [Candidatus Thermoplasmatota archaeon]
MPKTLTERDATAKLKDLPGWRLQNGHLWRDLQFHDFLEAMDFVNDLAALAEEQEHHPDIHIHYNQVSLEVWTHSEEGLTDKDFALAKEITKLIE